ncbi:MAG: glycosyltransferase [Cyclobacteriaceae bacterium]
MAEELIMVREKIRILHLIKSLGRGGAEMLLPETLKHHQHEKFEFHYIYFLPWKNQMVESLEQAGGKVTCMQANNTIQILLKVFTLIKYCRKHKINLIHCHLPWAGIVGRLVFKLIHTPLIYTEHNKQERYHRITRFVNRLTFNWQSAIIAVSEDVTESIARNIRPSVPVRNIVNGVNTDFFQRDSKSGRALRTQLGIPEEAIVVGTVAVFRVQKRLDVWLNVFKSASERDIRLYGILVGDGPLRKELEQLRKNFGLEHRVFMPGLQSDVRPWYSAMDIFMMTSLFEGLPVALLEAMSMQCAVLTTDAGGVKEVVRNEKDGLMVPVENWIDLTEKIDSLVNHERFRRDLGETARKRVINKFSINRMVTELEKLYSEVYKIHANLGSSAIAQ